MQIKNRLRTAASVGVLFAATKLVRLIWAIRPGECGDPKQNADELINAAVVDAVGEFVHKEHAGQNVRDPHTRDRIAAAVSAKLHTLLGDMQEGAVSVRVTHDGRIIGKILCGRGNLLEVVWATQEDMRSSGWEG